MKKRILASLGCMCAFFVCIFTLCIMFDAQVDEIRQSVFRFHVIANSDSDIDQQNKLAVRDGIASLCSELFENCDNKQQSMQKAKNSLDKIESEAMRILRLRGDGSSVRATVKKRFFPTRSYEGVTLPAGVYDTLDIQIGNASGKNFWCVMFPDICLGASTARSNKDKMSSVLSDDNLELVTENSDTVKFKFRIVEIIQNTKRFFSKKLGR